MVAQDIAARIRYGGMTLKQAAGQVILTELPRRNARGGVVAVDREGEVVMVFNSPGMIRGRVTDREQATVADYE